MFWWKQADHAEDRFKERLPKVPIEVLENARDLSYKIPPGPEDRMHLPLVHDGTHIGYAAYKRVGKSRKPVLATILGPNMTPKNSHLLNMKALKSEGTAKTAGYRKVASVDVEGSPRDFYLEGIKGLGLGQYGGLSKGQISFRPERRSNVTADELKLFLQRLNEIYPIENIDEDVLEKALSYGPKPNQGTLPEAIYKVVSKWRKGHPGQEKYYGKRVNLDTFDPTKDHTYYGLTPEQFERQGLHIYKGVHELQNAPVEQRANIINRLKAQGEKLVEQNLGAEITGLLGFGENLGKHYKKILGGVGLASTGTLLAIPHAVRAALKRRWLSPEERQLSEEEQDKLLQERSVVYRQYAQKESLDKGSDIKVRDVLNLIQGVGDRKIHQGLFLAQPQALRNWFTDPREGLARVIGAQQLWHGTSEASGKNIALTGIDPGYGGSPTGYTNQATHLQNLRSLLEGMSLTELHEALSDPEIGPLLRKQVLSWRKDTGSIYNAERLQPSVRITGTDIELPLDASGFLRNAHKNIFLATDMDAARNYALSQNRALVPGLLEAIKGFDSLAEEKPNLSFSDILLDKRGREFFKKLTEQQLANLVPGKNTLFATALPVEEYQRLFMPDSDDVQQGGTAVKLKPEITAQVNSYVDYYDENGNLVKGVPAPKPGEKAKHFRIEPEMLSNTGQNRYSTLWKARSRDWGGYVLGKGLDPSQKAFGLNRRFLSGVGMLGTQGALNALNLHRTFTPIVKKLYRKAKKYQAQRAVNTDVLPLPNEEVTDSLSAANDITPGLVTPEMKVASVKTKLFAGLRVRVDRPRGTVQKGKDSKGNPWERTYLCDYGYLAGTQGGDGDGMDVFLGPKEDGKAFLIVQKKEDGKFDEFKVMLGFPDQESARKMYLDHVPAKYFDSIREIPIGVLQGLTGRPVDHEKVSQEAFEASFDAYLGW